MDNPSDFTHLFFRQFWRILKMDYPSRRIIRLSCETGHGPKWKVVWVGEEGGTSDAATPAYTGNSHPPQCSFPLRNHDNELKHRKKNRAVSTISL